MTDHTELIERLRTRNGSPNGFGLGPVCDKAADALEAQAREIAIHRKNIERLDSIINEQAAEIEALRAVADASRIYYEHYMQDEADSAEYCTCGEEQHKRAQDVRDALHAMQGVKG